MSSRPTLAKPKSADSQSQVVFQVVVLVLLLVLLVNYKWAAGLGKIQQTRASGSLHLVKLQFPGISSFNNAIGYLKIVWPALIFGILISAAVRTNEPKR